MKVGNIIGGLEVTDVKRVNKLNLIQFLKEVDSYLQQGYQIDVTSGRQVGLVLQTDMFKTEAASSVKVGSTNATSTGEGSVGELFVVESNSVETAEEVVAEVTEQPKENVVLESMEDYKTRLEKEGFSTNFIDGENKEEVDMKDSEVPVKKPTQRTKKTT